MATPASAAWTRLVKLSLASAMETLFIRAPGHLHSHLSTTEMTLLRRQSLGLGLAGRATGCDPRAAPQQGEAHGPGVVTNAEIRAQASGRRIPGEEQPEHDRRSRQGAAEEAERRDQEVGGPGEHQHVSLPGEWLPVQQLAAEELERIAGDDIAWIGTRVPEVFPAGARQCERREPQHGTGDEQHVTQTLGAGHGGSIRR